MSTIRRYSRFSTPEGVSPGVRRYLETGEGSADYWDVFELSGPSAAHRVKRRAAWNSALDEILADWIEQHPGTRPWAWWEFDAPRWTGPYPPRCADAARHLANMPEPRRRLGGTGDPAFEHLNVKPRFDHGVPTSWVSDFDERYYNGRARDVHGRPIGQEYRPGHFKGKAPRRDDPPVYESEASYLGRHGLLSEDERRRLPGDAFRPVQITGGGDGGNEQ